MLAVTRCPTIPTTYGDSPHWDRLTFSSDPLLNNPLSRRAGGTGHAGPIVEVTRFLKTDQEVTRHWSVNVGPPSYLG